MGHRPESRPLRGRPQSAGGSRQDSQAAVGTTPSASDNRQSAIENRQSTWRLTTAERKRILLNNLYGVDIDPQAVEVTKLSLLLKVLEGESGETLTRQYDLFHERALPDLAANIKCGNSLIAPDFYKAQQATLFDEEETYRINAFDWAAEFPEIMSAGGFDAVIGNPPYGSPIERHEASYFRQRYEVFSGAKDVYALFMEKTLTLLAQRGSFSFIVPSAWLGGPAYALLRRLLLRNTVERVVLLPYDVFPEAYVDTCVVVIKKGPARGDHQVSTFLFGKRDRLRTIGIAQQGYSLVNQSDWEKSSDQKFVLDPGTVRVLGKLGTTAPRTLGEVAHVKRGVLFDPALLTESQTSECSYRYFEGNVYRYRIDLVTDRWVQFDDRMRERPKEFFWFQGRRVLLRRLVNRRQRLMACLAESTFITNKNLYSVIPCDRSVDALLLLAILNSRLISYLYVRQITQAVKDDFPQVTMKDLLCLPFPSSTAVDCLSPNITQLAAAMVELNRRLQTAKTSHDQTALRRQIEATDREIDELVYPLYGLTPEEIKIVEEATGG